MIVHNDALQGCSTQFEGDSFMYSTIAGYGDKEWAAKELLNCAANVIKGNSWALKVEMKQVGFETSAS